MNLALKDIKESRWNLWPEFYSICKTHSSFAEIGLGLAIGKIGKNIDLNGLNFSLIQKMTVYDGVGFFYGLFQERKTISLQELPYNLEEIEFEGFDQGLGRRLWYVAEGNSQLLHNIINSFQTNRLHALWRGVGKAVGYVGGNNEQEIVNLKSFAKSYLNSLQTGISYAVYARNKSNTLSAELEKTVNLLCGIEMNELLDSFSIHYTHK